MISSSTREVVIGGGRPTVLIGERINLSARKRLREALEAGDLESVRREAEAQAKAGADVLDIHVGAPGTDEVTLLPKVVEAVMDAVDLPLCIDSTDAEALEASLEVYEGKALVNSVTGEEGSLEKILPLVKKHRAAVIGLVQDEGGVPADPERRIEIAGKIIEKAGEAGIPPRDVLIDCLVLTVGADNDSGKTVLATVKGVRERLGVNVILGASNISFGLPDRDLLNGAFATLAVGAGATGLIGDAAKLRPFVLAADLLLGKDRYARRYIAEYRRR